MDRHLPSIHHSERYVARDGALLYQRRWWPAHARAAAVIVHGLGEHAGRYDHVARALAAAGIDVLAFDLRGFGASSGMRGDVRRFSDRLDDVAWAIAEQRQRLQRRPLLLLGHSMGGLIAARYVQSDRTPPDLLLLSGAAIDPRLMEGRQCTIAAGRVMARLLPHLRMPFSSVDALSSDPEVARRMRADPLRVPGLGLRLGLQLVEEQRRAWVELADITMPVLLLHGGDDQVVPAVASRDAAPLLGSADVTLHIYTGMLHEVFNERERQQVLDDVTSWLTARLPA